MTGRRAQVLLRVYMTSYVTWLIISGQAQVYIPEVAGDKYLAGTEGPHNISSCHLLYSQLVICSSSSSSVKISPSSIDYFIMAGVDITLHGYYYLNRWHILYRERGGDFEIFNIYVVRTHTIRGPQYPLLPPQLPCRHTRTLLPHPRFLLILPRTRPPPHHDHHDTHLEFTVPALQNRLYIC